jgi:RNA polymerase sigma factor (sigma-70 family)
LVHAVEVEAQLLGVAVPDGLGEPHALADGHDLALELDEPIADTDDSIRLLDQGPTPEDISERDRELTTLAEAILALPERCRTILVLRKHHGLSHREIADRLGISPNTVNAQITAAMIKCRAYFQQRGLLASKADET